MAYNLGKEWEDIVEEWLKENNICYDRIHDQMSGKKGSTNVCDYDAYIYPHMYYLECKECASSLFSMLQNISEYQWIHMLQKDIFPGVRAGYVIWMSRENRAFWISPLTLDLYYSAGKKSVSVDDLEAGGIELTLYQKRTKWHLETLLDVVEQHLAQVN
jgi:hypothetical protein